MPNITSIPAPRVPFIDDRTGLISREWYRFLINIFTLTGSGTSDLTIADLAIAPNPVDPFTALGSAIEQSQLASITAQYSQFLDIVGAAPAVQPQFTQQDDLFPRSEAQPFPDDLSPVATPYVAPTAAENATVLAATITAATSKTTPVDADELPLVDSAASNVLKKLTWANLKATLLTWLQGTVFPAPGPIGGTTAAAGSFTTVTASTSIKPLATAGYLSSDGSAGYTGTITTGSLVGKTITIKDGIITAFA